ncbi:MAG: transposase [Deltaproteobacteria bacterium]
MYYITTRAIQGQNLFGDAEDYAAYLELLAKYKTQQGARLFAFVLLPTHLHLLLETPAGGGTLSEVMHNLTSAYTKYYNKKYNRQGHLFRGRYRATIIEKDPYLLRLTRYIHLNPSHVGREADYPYSSLGHYTEFAPQGVRVVDMKEEVKEVLGHLSAATYSDYMRQQPAEEGRTFHKELHRKICLGSEDFAKRIYEMLEKPEAEEAAPRKKRLVLPLISSMVVAAVAGSVLFYAHQKNQRRTDSASAVVEESAPEAGRVVIPFDIVGLDGSVWQIKFVAGTPFQTVDEITFKDGKMSSENLELNGYPASHYTLIKENGRLTWETMQTSEKGSTGSWHAEVEDGRMQGVLSLRAQDGASQDFSFVSMDYRRAEP